MNAMNDDYKNFIVMNKSNHSYSINRKITEKFNSDSWRGKRCFIIGGGPSLENFDYHQLDNELTIGVNKSFKNYPNATINYSMDSPFYDDMKAGKLDDSETKLWDQWNSFTGTHVFLTPMEIKNNFGKEVFLVRRCWAPSINREDLDKGIYGGCNSGLGAIMLALALGALPIYLLGYDLKVDGNKTHNHDGYPNRNVEEFNKKLSEYCQEIWNLSDLFVRSDVDIVNLNKDSQLRCFRFENLEEVINVASYK